MGVRQSNLNSRAADPKQARRDRERDRQDNMLQHGTVTVRITWLGNNRRAQDRHNIHNVSARGALFHGSNCSPNHILDAIEVSNKFRPRDVSLSDSRAHQLLTVYSDGWYAIPSLEIFSRHSGTCIVIGDKKNPGKPYPMKLGDCFRLGSVGLVVSEIKTMNGIEKRLDTKHLQYLREEALAFDTEQEEACLAAMEGEERDRERGGRDSPPKTSAPVSERFICYMCYETHDTPTDQLVAPCDCKGDTRYLHVQCLQKWYQTSVCGPRAQVIRTTGNGAPACKICGAAYKTAFRSLSGRRVSLLEMDSGGPYLSLVVVTKHDTSPGLFNTKFRLNFGSQHTDNMDLSEPPGSLNVGRSSASHMILDYRTVSTTHAKIFHLNNEFFIQDARSSNGTMAYIQEPLPIHFARTTRIRMGRCTLALQARRNWGASLRNVFLPARPRPLPYCTPAGLFTIMSAAAPPGSMRLKAEREEILKADENNNANIATNATNNSEVISHKKSRDRSPLRSLRLSNVNNSDPSHSRPHSPFDSAHGQGGVAGQVPAAGSQPYPSSPRGLSILTSFVGGSNGNISAVHLASPTAAHGSTSSAAGSRSTVPAAKANAYNISGEVEQDTNHPSMTYINEGDDTTTNTASHMNYPTTLLQPQPIRTLPQHQSTIDINEYEEMELKIKNKSRAIDIRDAGGNLTTVIGESNKESLNNGDGNNAATTSTITALGNSKLSSACGFDSPAMSRFNAGINNSKSRQRSRDDTELQDTIGMGGDNSYQIISSNSITSPQIRDSFSRNLTPEERFRKHSATYKMPYDEISAAEREEEEEAEDTNNSSKSKK